MISCTLDDPDGIVFIQGTGAWTLADVDRHYARLRAILDERRNAGQPVRVLSDVTGAQRQAAEIEARILWHMEQTYQKTDRVAILVADVADKMYVRARLGQAIVGVFASQLPAEMWLMSDDLQPPGLAA